MISFDLKCDGGHVFEIWFRSSADYKAQRTAGQILCPTCGSETIDKAVMAPAVGLKGNQQPSVPASVTGPFMAPDGGDKAAEMRALVQALAQAQAEALRESQWVGDKFADRARAMHYGEVEQSAIHGTADAREAREMMEEGLPVAPLLVPIASPDKTN